MITKQQLLDDGCQRNYHIWIGPGWLYCRGCQQYTYCVAYSHPGTTDCYELCLQCHEYHGTLTLKGSPMPVASDILESAKELRQRYANGLHTEPVGKDLPSEPPEDLGHEDCEVCKEARAAKTQIPAHVFVLLQSGTVLGVLTAEQKAITEAHSLMTAYAHRLGSCVWETLVPHRCWRSGDGTIVEISAHDVR